MLHIISSASASVCAEGKKSRKAKEAGGCMQTHTGMFLKKISEKLERLANGFFDCSHATVSGIVSRLAEKGYVSVEPDKSDRRAKNVFLTDKERDCFSQMLARQRAIEDKLVAGFSPEEKKRLSEYLSRIDANLDDGREGKRPRLTGERRKK